jgi:hypothetical protein
MKLPATFKRAFEGQMIAEARAVIRSVRDEEYTLPPDSFAPGLKVFRFGKADGRRTEIEVLKAIAKIDVHHLRKIIGCAEDGWKEAHEALHELDVECTLHGEQAPVFLRVYMHNVSDPQRRRPRRRGRPPGGSSLGLRDMTIVCIVAVICERFNIPAERNQGSKHLNSCAVVARALEEEQREHGGAGKAGQKKMFLTLSESSIETLWTQWGRDAFLLIFDTPYPFGG